jgi:hypothetical protein
MTYLVLAENEIITAEGRQLSFDQMVDNVNRNETVLRFSHGNFACSCIQDIQADLRCEELAVTKVTLSTGEQFLLLDTSEILTTDNKWVKVSEVEVGDGMKTLTYNPSVRHPQLTPKIITSLDSYVAPFLPVVSFETLSDNLLLSVARGSNISILIPLRPTKELASVSLVC